MDDLTPVTRTERLLDGEDLTPTNREEMFIKRIYDKTQDIPEPVNRKEYFLKKAGEAGGDVTVVPLSVTSNGTYSEEGKAYSPVTVEVEPPEDSYQLKSITTPTSLATFNASAMPMPKLKVSVEAKQDLHGYDHPWVGGAGKNKMPLVLADIKTLNTSGTWSGDAYTISGVTFTILTDSNGNVTGVSANGTATGSITFLLTGTNGSWMTGGTTYKINGSVGGSYNTWSIWVQGHGTYQSEMSLDGDGTFTYTVGGSTSARISVDSGVSLSNQMFKPMIRLASESDATFAPYSNICPISGWDAAKVSDVDDVENPTVTQTTTIALPQTVYGAEVDVVNGILKITDGYIASYNGETLPSTWISSMDEYAEGTSPTTGAEVCYELANPIIINLTPTLIKSLNGQNNLSVDCGDVIEGEYFKALGGE